MTKPQYVIDLRRGAQSCFPSHATLSLVEPSSTYHNLQGYRQPLGIYNISLIRILRRTENFCRKLEVLFSDFEQGHEEGRKEIEDEISDYLELALYSAAEHVDEVKAIADGFFKRGRQQAKGSEEYRKLDNKISLYKKKISAYVNAIKHDQSRIRFCTSDLMIDGKHVRLYGYFVEGVSNGAVGPNPVFHGSGNVFSITSLAWEIICFLLQCSSALNDFLLKVAKLANGPTKIESEKLKNAVLSAARLPIYSFDDSHPFDHLDLEILFDNHERDLLASHIYGSMLRPWGAVKTVINMGAKTQFVGDGVTDTFKFPTATKVSLKGLSKK